VFCCFALFARDNPDRAGQRTGYRQLLRQRDLWRLNLFYTVTFGGFVGLASFLPIFFCDQYDCSRVAAGTWAAACVFAGSFLRPLGGSLADRFGGVRVLRVLYVVVIALVTALANLPAFPYALTLLVLTTGSLGMGNGAVFQLVGQRFHREVGVATGIVGACSGVGGFVLPSSLGLLKEVGGSYGLGFAAFAVAATGAVVALAIAQREWQQTWGGLQTEGAPG
jgi:NNP family nitrate/nitrite transporter-like MFS transporter